MWSRKLVERNRTFVLALRNVVNVGRKVSDVHRQNVAHKWVFIFSGRNVIKYM